MRDGGYAKSGGLGGVTSLMQRLRGWWGRVTEDPRSRKLPWTPISEVQDGKLVKVAGTAMGYPVPGRTPLSGLLAATFTVQARELVGGQGENQRLALRADIDGGQSFLLQDDTGVVRVNRKGWSDLLVDASVIPPFYERSSHLEQYENEHGALPHAFHKRRSVCSERCIPEGAQVLVVGVARNTGEPMTHAQKGGYRVMPTWFELEPADGKMLITTRGLPRA